MNGSASIDASAGSGSFHSAGCTEFGGPSFGSSSGDGKYGKLPFDLRAVATDTFNGRGMGADNFFKFSAALIANIFKQWHFILLFHPVGYENVCIALIFGKPIRCPN